MEIHDVTAYKLLRILYIMNILFLAILHNDKV